jgi:hypothetical protein
MGIRTAVRAVAQLGSQYARVCSIGIDDIKVDRQREDVCSELSKQWVVLPNFADNVVAIYECRWWEGTEIVID